MSLNDITKKMYGYNLRYYRTINHQKLSDLAKLCGTSSPVVSNWETGKTLPSSDHRKTLELIYKVDLFIPIESNPYK